MRSLLEIHEQLVTALGALREEKRGALLHRLVREPTENWAEITKTIALARQQLIDEFVETTAPPIIKRENPVSANSILETMRKCQARAERSILEEVIAQPEPLRWRPSAVRAILAAAFGAAAGVILLLLIHGAPEPVPQVNPAVTAPATAVAPAGGSSEAAQAPAKSPAPAAGTAKAPDAPTSATRGHVAMLLILLAAALGAALGAAIMFCPPLDRVLESVGLRRRVMLSGGLAALVSGTILGAFKGLRGKIFAAGGSAATVLSAILGWITGYGLLIAFFVMFAVLTVVLVRATAPHAEKRSHRDTAGHGLEAFDRLLKVDIAEWSALTASLIHATTRSSDPRAGARNPKDQSRHPE